MAMTDSQIRSITDSLHLDVYNRLPLVLDHGEGARVWSTDGTEYIDALAGIAVNCLGHCHPRVVQAIREQSARLMHISNFYYSEPQARLLKLIHDMSGFGHIFLCNSGAEAVEGVLKVARKWAARHNKRGKILTLSHAFHGRTIGTISMGMEKYHRGYDPLLPGFHEVPLNDTSALDDAFTDDTVGIILEPIQGSGGLHPVSAEFMHLARQLCREHQALLMIDEVQTGIGRTGEFYAYEHYGIDPDLVATAKGLGSGFPVGAVLASDQAAGAMGHGDHGSTYGGNPLACAAAHATLVTVRDEDLAGEAARKGSLFMDYLNEICQEIKSVRDIRGKGLMVGVELAFPGQEVVHEMMKRGVLANCTAKNVIRLVPPLVIAEEQLRKVAEVLGRSIESAESVK